MRCTPCDVARGCSRGACDGIIRAGHVLTGKPVGTEIGIAVLVFVCVLSGAALGAFVRPMLPDHHMNEASRQIVIVAIGLIATLSALVLGLLVASAKGGFDDRNQEIKQSATRLVELDRLLRQFGPEANDVRKLLLVMTQKRIDSTWNTSATRSTSLLEERDAAQTEQVRTRLWDLKPVTDAQRWVHARALTLTAEIEHARWLLLEGSQSSIPRPFLAVLTFWLSAIFAALGLFAPRNATVYSVLVICALSVSTAVLMIFEMDQPFEGILEISPAPLHRAVEEMRR